MICQICLEKIQYGQSILIGSSVIFDGPGEDDFTYAVDDNDEGLAIHISCLQRPLEAIVLTPNRDVKSEVRVGVERSNALDLFGI